MAIFQTCPECYGNCTIISEKAILAWTTKGTVEGTGHITCPKCRGAGLVNIDKDMDYTLDFCYPTRYNLSRGN